MIDKCDVATIEAGKYSIKYTPTTSGRHELTVLRTRSRRGGGVRDPTGTATNSVGEMIVTEWEGDNIKINNEICTC